MNTIQYQPNFNDPRVLKKLESALNFTLTRFKDDKIVECSTRAIDNHFGQSQHDLSKWMRSELLICVNDKFDHFSAESQCKTYRANQDKVAIFKTILDTNKVARKVLKKRFKISGPVQRIIATESIPASVAHLVANFSKEDLENYCIIRRDLNSKYRKEFRNGVFPMAEKSNRRWHSLQKVRRDFRPVLFAEHGFMFDYDMETACATILYQHAKACGLQGSLPTLESYIGNKQDLRAKVAKLAEVDIDTAKQIITSMFCGAYLGCGPRHSIFNTLDRDTRRAKQLQADPVIQALRLEIKQMWIAIGTTIKREERHYPTSSGEIKTKLLKIKPRHKWKRYFELEFQIGTVIINYLKRTGNPYFYEHDGWRTKNEVNTVELINAISERTKFKIKLSETKL